MSSVISTLVFGFTTRMRTGASLSRRRDLHEHRGVVAESPGVVPRRDRERVAGLEVVARAVRELDREPPRDEDADVRRGAAPLARVERPAPARVVRDALQLAVAFSDDVDDDAAAGQHAALGRVV